MLTILSHVCAEFVNHLGKTIVAIEPQNLEEPMVVPDEIREDPLFDMLIADGSMQAVESVKQNKDLEAEATAETTAEGKKAAKTKKSSGGKTAASASSGASGELSTFDLDAEQDEVIQQTDTQPDGD